MASALEQLERTLDMDAFLAEYPEFDFRPRFGGGLKAVGIVDRRFQAEGLPPLRGRFSLVVEFPAEFPEEGPIAYETENVIPRQGRFHREKGRKGPFCLAAPLVVLESLRRDPSACSVFERLVFPFLYRFLYIKGMGASPPGWGDLAHEDHGRLAGHKKLLQVKTNKQLFQLVRLLASTPAKASRLSCFCGRSLPLARCHLQRVEQIRNDVRLLPQDYERELDFMKMMRGTKQKKRKR